MSLWRNQLGKKKEPKRFIKLEGIDKILDITKGTMIKSVGKEFIYLDKLIDGTWRLCWTEDTIPDMAKIKSFNFIRE